MSRAMYVSWTRFLAYSGHTIGQLRNPMLEQALNKQNDSFAMVQKQVSGTFMIVGRNLDNDSKSGSYQSKHTHLEKK